MKKIILIISVISSISLISCEVTDFDLQDDPNLLTPDSADPNFILNEVQISFGEVMQDLSINTDDIMRYEAMTDSYTDVAEPDALDGEWKDMYQMRENILLIERLAADNESLLFHRGMAKILHAYGMTTLVDFLGDIPFTEANDGENFAPAADDDATIYASLLADIDLAITDLTNATVKPALDIYYGGDEAQWIKLANSLKLRLYINMGESAAVNALISQDNLINDASDDFQFQNSKLDTPESRHSYFQRGYGSGGFTQYIGNYFIWLLKDSKTLRDPRLRYYVYRQTNVNPQDIPGNFVKCLDSPIHDFCYVGDFYWARDHGDDDTRPNDRELKATYGLYPAGGAFDADNAVTASDADNLGGAGIFPVLLSSYVDFLRAEAVLSLGASGDASAYLESGIRKSMEKVLSFSTVDPSFAATQADVDDYVNFVLGEYALAASDQEKLDLVIREYYLAAYGNSIEAYNAYRRTGYPSNIQIPIKSESIPFPRTFSLPKDAVTRNTSLNQRPITNQTFWDTNPAGFIK